MRRILQYLVCMIVLLATVSCDLRELTYRYYPFCSLRLVVDWSLFGETPSGMTAIFYPREGDRTPIVHTTNSVHSTSISLSKGIYDIILFNQSPGEFSTLGFRGLGRYDTAEVCLQKAGRTEGACLQPERFAVATMENLAVTEEMVERSGLTSIMMTPKCIVTPGVVIIHIDGINSLYSLGSSISGVAASFLPAPYESGDGTTAHVLGPWTMHRDDDNPQKGVIESTFSSFGHPCMPLSRPECVVTTRAPAYEWEDASIDLSMLLTDNKTVMEYSFKVRDYVRKVEEDGQLTLIIEIEDLIMLPETGAQNNAGGGFGAVVDDWGEEEKVQIGK